MKIIATATVLLSRDVRRITNKLFLTFLRLVYFLTSESSIMFLIIISSTD